jgi:sulfide:quinone oxidoreductase
MADIRQITPSFAVAPQIEAADFAALVSLGYRTVIDNRPDGESPDDLQSADALAAAKAAGLAFIYAPFQGQPTPQAVEAVIQAGPGPVLAYCRSGTRSITAWAMAQAKTGLLDAGSIVAAGHAAGYDLSPLKNFLRSLRAEE